LISNNFILAKFILKSLSSYNVNLKISTNFVTRSSRKILKVSRLEIIMHPSVADYCLKKVCSTPQHNFKVPT